MNSGMESLECKIGCRRCHWATQWHATRIIGHSFRAREQYEWVGTAREPFETIRIMRSIKSCLSVFWENVTLELPWDPGSRYRQYHKMWQTTQVDADCCAKLLRIKIHCNFEHVIHLSVQKSNTFESMFIYVNSTSFILSLAHWINGWSQIPSQFLGLCDR